MKKLLSSITLIVLAGILFSSCSNSSKLAFTKRHYRSGYFADRVGKSNTTANKAVTGIALKPERQIAIPGITKSVKSIVVSSDLISTAKQPCIVQKITASKKIAATTSTDIYMAPSIPGGVSLNKSGSNNVEGSVGDSHRGRDEISVPLIVIVLCAIFIPPLGVGLMYGLNSYFWIDLILTLLFFFPGMIFALIVVLM